MDFSPQSFVSVNEILADVLRVTNDSGFKISTKGWYISQIRQALQELSFDTYFDERNEELIIPDDLRVEMPKGSFNLKQIYLFNGDKCNVGQNTPNVYFKQNFWTGGNGFLARDKWNNNGDPFYRSRTGSPNPQARNEVTLGSRSQLYFFGIQNGLIMLSDSCRKFEKIMVFFNGIGGELDNTPVIPQFFRQAVKDYVTSIGLEVAIASADASEFNRLSFLKSSVDQRMNKPFDGTWAKAEQRAKQTNSKVRQDYKEYLARMNY